MYGLMKAHVCSRHKQEAQERRMHYCGTCKTMGRLYGQQTRFLLNNDAIFLAELLTALTSQSRSAPEWARAYRSYNCFALPSDNSEMPLPLQIAATATVVMAEFKVADQITDGGGGRWKLARRLLSPAFMAAAERMKAWEFPVEDFWRWAGVQAEREAAGARGDEQTTLDGLNSLAEPTAAVTALVFAHGAAAVGADRVTQQGMYEVGFAFGALIYTLDAYDDFARDMQHGDFNALQATFRIQDGGLSDDDRAMALDYLHGLRDRMETALRALPLHAKQATMFAARLRTNLDRRLAEPGTQKSPGRRAHVALNLFRVALSPIAVAQTRQVPVLATANGPSHGPHGSAGIPSSTGVRRVRQRPNCCICCCDGCDDIACCGDGCCCACESCDCLGSICSGDCCCS